MSCDKSTRLLKWIIGVGDTRYWTESTGNNDIITTFCEFRKNVLYYLVLISGKVSPQRKTAFELNVLFDIIILCTVDERIDFNRFKDAKMSVIFNIYYRLAVTAGKHSYTILSIITITYDSDIDRNISYRYLNRRTRITYES